MSDTTWTMKLYDRNGNEITANYSGYSDRGITNEIAHATDRTLGFNLNNYDTCDFTLYLDDPMAKKIKRLTSFVKVWRSVPGYTSPSTQPDFAGIVGYHKKFGNQNIMQVKCFSPWWRLQFRFHLLNHYLKTNPDTSLDYKQSELIMRLITFLSNAFGPSISYLGIEQGTFYDVANEINMAPYFQPKGANAWTEIFDGILAKAASIDIIPRYAHADGNPALMYFDSALKRGADKSSSVSFEYHDTSPSNCDDMTEEEFVQPGDNSPGTGFANYVWAVGAGGPNSGKVAVQGDSGAINEGYNAIGMYMKRTDYPDEKLLGVDGGNPPSTSTHLKANAINDLARAIVPNLNYEVTVSPAGGIYYNNDFTLGDVVNLNANKGALVVNNVKQRIYQASISISDNNVETPSVLVSKDFTGKVAT